MEVRHVLADLLVVIGLRRLVFLRQDHGRIMVELGQRVAAFVRVEDRHHERLHLDEDVLVRDPERLAAPLQRRVDLHQQVDEVREVVVLIIASALVLLAKMLRRVRVERRELATRCVLGVDGTESVSCAALWA